MSDAVFTKDDFLKVCKTQPEEAKKVLIDKLSFTFDGINNVYGRKPEEAAVFFAGLLGEPFTSSEGQVTKVLEIGFSGPEKMADVMYFMYNNQKEEEEEKVETTEAEATETVEKKKGRGRGKVKIDWASKKIPFSEKSKQYVVFSQLKDFNGGKKEFLDYMAVVFKNEGLETKSIAGLVAHTISDASKRGWEIGIVEGKYKVLKAS